jgi:hypothetical protein
MSLHTDFVLLTRFINFQSGDWVQLKVLETTPSLTQLGASLEIAEELRLSHENVLKQLQVR